MHAPDVARRALLTATEDGVARETAGAVATLAAELGLEALQERSIGLLVAPENAGPHIVRFDSVEEVLAHIQESTRRYRDAFGEWLGGRAPAAVAMHSDLKAFARLFLAAEDERLNQLGDRFRMLLRSGARKQATQTVDDERPPLLLDLSALLLAHPRRSSRCSGPAPTHR